MISIHKDVADCWLQDAEIGERQTNKILYYLQFIQPCSHLQIAIYKAPFKGAYV